MFYSATELLNHNILGLPQTQQGLLKLAKKLGWQSRKRQGKGGGKEFLLTDVLSMRGAEKMASQTALRPNSNCKKAFVIEIIIAKLDEKINIAGSKSSAIAAFVEDYNARAIGFDGELNPYHFIKKLSRATLYRWTKTPSLNYGNRKGQGLIERSKELQQAIEACLAASHTDWNPKQILRVLETQYKFPKLPSIHQVYRWCKTFAQFNKQKWVNYQSKADYKNKLKPAFGQRTQMMHPNQEWQIDSSPSDLFLKYQGIDGTWKQKRFALVACIDGFSRRVKIAISPTSKSEAIIKLLRDCIQDWGLPSVIKSDNGADYISHQTSRFLKDLGIKHHRCTPGQPEEKPLIERFFKTFQHGKLEMLPGYCGHNVSDRKRKAADIEISLTPEEFEQWTAAWVNEYHSTKHSGINCTPLEKLAEANQQGWVKRSLEDIRKLDFLLLSAQTRKVGKEGIKLNGRLYVASRLGGYVGESVHVRYDANDPNEIFVYKDESLSGFICRAGWDESPGIDLPKVAYEAKREAAKLLNDETRRISTEVSRIKRRIAKDPLSLIDQKGNVKPFVRSEASKALEHIEMGCKNNSREHYNEFALPLTGESEFLKQEDVKTLSPAQEYKHLFNKVQMGGDLTSAEIGRAKQLQALEELKFLVLTIGEIA